MCEGIISVTKNASTNVKNNISTNVAGTMSINFDNKKIRYNTNYYIMHALSLVTILLFVTAIIWYHYIKHTIKQKHYWDTINKEMEKTNEIKNVNESCICYYFGGKNKIEDFLFNNTFLDEKSYENILIYDVMYKTLIGTKPSLISTVKWMSLLETVMKLNI